MWKFKETNPGCFCHLLVAILILATWGRGEEIRDFIAANTLPDGEVETRIYYKGVSAKEITVGRRSLSDIKFRQVTNRHHLLQLIYNGEDLKDCEIVHQRDQVVKFLETFKSDLRNLISTSNITIESLDNKKLPSEIAPWFNFTLLKSTCKKLHHRMKKEVLELKNGQQSERGRQKRSVLIVPGTLWCGDSDNAKKYSHLGPMAYTDKCCRRHDHCKRNIPGFTTKYNFHNYSPFTLSHCWCDSRHKRDVSDLLRVPGTKWCGKGYSADKYTRLGGFSRTDKCCRRHDLSCRFWIGAFETKYGLFNWRINTIMHCSCDERFRACLKMVDSSDANLVGKLFFNVVQTKCFVIKPRKICVKSTWWGQCEKYKHIKQAILRDNLPY
ncbi:uncharacterized protein LOC123003971 isoform X3 [Tribolium madens]|uniref:uncharacterized protein LOC123003971 isoform X3 n=1 Tax=Tribolium madens TaxID=41895 RepID=UPI001CF72E51|nr:uncharacterized protein LOC123003971 isoform X3 [Tribolium madens]